MSETTCAAIRPERVADRGWLGDQLPVRPRDPRHHQLRDSIAGRNRPRLRAQVHQDELDLAAVVGVDRAGGR